MIETHYYDNCNIYQDADPETATCAFIFPEDYGAKGDGTTDDADAIQNCIADAETTKKVIYFSGGKVYKCSKTLTINTPIQMTGATTNSATILSEAATALEIICNLETVATTLNLSIGNLIFKSAAWTENTAPTVDNIAIKFNDSWLMYMQLKNLQFFGYNKCFYFYGTANNRPYAHNILISHVNTWDCNNIIDQHNTSDGGSFVYGGDIEFIQFENIHNPFNTPYVINLNLWQNLNLRNLIIEGRADAAYTGVVYVNKNTFECDNFYLEMLGTAVSRAIFVQETSNTYGGIKVANIYGQPTENKPWADTDSPATLQFSFTVTAPQNVLVNANSFNIIESINCGSYWSGLATDDILPGGNIYKMRNNGNVNFIFNNNPNFIAYRGTNTDNVTYTGTAQLTPLGSNAKYDGMGWTCTAGTVKFDFHTVKRSGVFEIEIYGTVNLTAASARKGSVTKIANIDGTRREYYFMHADTTHTATFSVGDGARIFAVKFYPANSTSIGEC